MTSLNSIISFVSLLNRFKTIERTIFATGTDRMENDAEHSFSLAMLGWYINETHKLGLDVEKILMYALAHDLVEVYAGDVFFYTKDEQLLKGKKQREADAAVRLKAEYPEFSQLHEAIDAYEKKGDLESKFLYALDKIEPILNIYNDKGRTWKEHSITIEMLESTKIQKVAVDPTIAALFKDIVARLKKEQKELFEVQ